MRDILFSYFIFGFGFYIGLCLKEPDGWVNASVASLLRGILLGIVFWPIGLIVQVIFAIFKEPSATDNGKGSDK